MVDGESSPRSSGNPQGYAPRHQRPNFKIEFTPKIIVLRHKLTHVVMPACIKFVKCTRVMDVTSIKFCALQESVVAKER